jgi:hypothetical protein
VEGDIFNSKGIIIYKLEGRWDKEMNLIDVSSGER